MHYGYQVQTMQQLQQKQKLLKNYRGKPGKVQGF